jgi:hypothetical protein
LSALTSLWRYASFQQAATKLVQLPSDALADYADASENSFEIDARLVAKYKLEPLDAELAESAARAIYETTSRAEIRPSPDEVVAELEEVTATQLDDDSREQLIRLFRPRPGYDQRRITELTSRSVMPVLDSVGASIDIRAVYHGDRVTGASALVPVILVRFEFDEPVLGGSSSVAFQMPAPFVGRLQEELSLLSDRLAQLETMLRPAGVPVITQGERGLR